MHDRHDDCASARSRIEKCKAAYLSRMSGDDVVANELLKEIAAVDGVQCGWDHVRGALWNCRDRLPREYWQEFQFAAENLQPICYAFAARTDAAIPLLMGFLETEKYDAVANLYRGLVDGLEGPV